MLKVLFTVLTICAAGGLSGATFTVLNVGDAGADTLRDAINQHNTAGGTNTIEFDTGLSGTINLASQLPVIDTGDLTIVGPGADVLTISGGGSVPCLGLNTLSATVSVTISGLTIADGSTTGVGAGINIVIIRSTANLTLTDCVFSGHQASFGGGAIYLSLVSGTPAFNLSVTGCTFSGNSSPLLEGAVILRDGDGTTTADFTNCTFSGNTATDDGGAIWADASSVTLTNCTITGNQAANGGGIFIAGGTLELRNTIVAGNTATASAPDIAGTATSLDGNLIGDDSGLTMAPQAADQGGTAAAPIDPMLGALADNGGTTPTHALLSGSPAINAGITTGAPADDQRGVTRDANPDIGAYEFVPPEIEVSHGAATVTNGGTVALTPDTSAGAARVETVTVSNVAIADADLDLSGGVSLSSQTNCTATVTSAPAATVIAGGDTTFDVEITPSAPGAYSVTVTISSNDPVNNPFVFTFTGNAAAAPGKDGDGDDDDESCSTGEGRGYAWLALLGVPAALAIRGYRGKRSR
jgi:predicted outer membrane repeat protein